MLKVEKEKKGNSLVIRLSGTLEESLNLDTILGDPEPKMDIFCKDVTRINSVGVRVWIKYFQRAAIAGTDLSFYECSAPIVEQINNISNFVCGGNVVSVSLPFICRSCAAELIATIKCEDIKAINFKLPTPKCSKCGGEAVFDDIPEEYFSFLD